MGYDPNAVNNAIFEPDGVPVSIPLNVSFKVIIPEKILSNIILRILFLQTFIITSAKIKLSAVNAPDWATVSIANENVYPNIQTNFSEAQTNLIIALHSNAPSESYNLKIKAETGPLLNNHIPANSAELSIVFKPKAVSLFQVSTLQDTVQTPPTQLTLIPINITNLGNAQMKVTAEINTSLEGWTKYIVPPELCLLMHETQQMTLLLIPPQDFQGTKSIDILFNSTSTSGENDSLLPLTIIAYYNIR